MSADQYILGLDGLGADAPIQAAKQLVKRSGGDEAANAFMFHMKKLGQKINHAYNTSNDPLYKWVMANAHRLGDGLKEKLEAGAAKVNRHTLYHIVDISGLKSIDVFGSGVGEITDFICNVNKGLIPINSNFVAEKVRILYGVKANSNDPLTAIDFSEGVLPTAIKNGVIRRFKFHQVPLFGPKYLLENFVNADKNKIEGLMVGEVVLPQYQLVKDNEIISLELSWAQAAATGACLKVMISGAIVSADTE